MNNILEIEIKNKMNKKRFETIKRILKMITKGKTIGIIYKGNLVISDGMILININYISNYSDISVSKKYIVKEAKLKDDKIVINIEEVEEFEGAFKIMFDILNKDYKDTGIILDNRNINSFIYDFYDKTKKPINVYFVYEFGKCPVEFRAFLSEDNIIMLNCQEDLQLFFMPISRI